MVVTSRRLFDRTPAGAVIGEVPGREGAVVRDRRVAGRAEHTAVGVARLRSMAGSLPHSEDAESRCGPSFPEAVKLLPGEANRDSG
jgi:hypothetical protein